MIVVDLGQGEEEMRCLRYVALLAVLMIPLAYSQAQVSVGIGFGPGYVTGPPVCAYGYYGYPPYACAPYGYYGPNWFVGGVFLGAGPWYGGYYGRGGWGRGYYGRGAGYYGRAGYGAGHYGRAGWATGAAPQLTVDAVLHAVQGAATVAALAVDFTAEQVVSTVGVDMVAGIANGLAS